MKWVSIDGYLLSGKCRCFTVRSFFRCPIIGMVLKKICDSGFHSILFIILLCFFISFSIMSCHIRLIFQIRQISGFFIYISVKQKFHTVSGFQSIQFYTILSFRITRAVFHSCDGIAFCSGISSILKSHRILNHGRNQTLFHHISDL